MLSTVAESPWFSVWKSGSLLDLSGSRMELSGEIGPGEHRLIYSWLDLSTQCAEGIETTQGSHPCNISLRTLKDRPNAPQPGQCFLSFISWPPTPRLQLSHPAVFFFSPHPAPYPVVPDGMYGFIWAVTGFHWICIALNRKGHLRFIKSQFNSGLMKSASVNMPGKLRSMQSPFVGQWCRHI